MIGVSKERWNDIPVLEVVEDIKKHEALPVLTYFHGFTSAKEHNLPLAYLLAAKGYRVVLPDSKFHGERQGETTDEERQLQFFNIVAQNLKDLAMIYEYMLEHDLIKDSRFGIAGTSMGGITTAAALTKYPWIRAAAILMGSPKITAYAQDLVEHMRQVNGKLPLTDDEIESIYQSLTEVDLSKQMVKLNQRPLFFWHGENDSVVPFTHAYSFYQDAIDYYENPENIRFLREPGRDHKVSRIAILETVNWFEIQL
ncbi:alpha/beta fold hydrolase [Aquibacillus sediminis]|uniref:alpha/beta fold hydrolase n=1 Tax=Aquibacillus sediminis TaxID=2574734 RepID=UPI001107B988|nr:alpha/beta fold hydrolase [Aquibacillus sediminis]